MADLPKSCIAARKAKQFRRLDKKIRTEEDHSSLVFVYLFNCKILWDELKIVLIIPSLHERIHAAQTTNSGKKAKWQIPWKRWIHDNCISCNHVTKPFQPQHFTNSWYLGCQETSFIFTLSLFSHASEILSFANRQYAEPFRPSTVELSHSFLLFCLSRVNHRPTWRDLLATWWVSTSHTRSVWVLLRSVSNRMSKFGKHTSYLYMLYQFKNLDMIKIHVFQFPTFNNHISELHLKLEICTNGHPIQSWWNLWTHSPHLGMNWFAGWPWWLPTKSWLV